MFRVFPFPTVVGVGALKIVTGRAGMGPRVEDEANDERPSSGYVLQVCSTDLIPSCYKGPHKSTRMA